MDLGVGSFVFSAGIVSAKPFLKRPENRFKPLGGQLINACKHAFPLFVLGFARLIAVKGVDYQEHVSEYGVHWNFFFTLAFLPIFVTLCRAVERYARFAVLGLVIIVGKEQIVKCATPMILSCSHLFVHYSLSVSFIEIWTSGLYSECTTNKFNQRQQGGNFQLLW